MNKCVFTGNLTRDPEQSTTQSGIARCSFTIAVQSKFRGEDGEYEVDFINIVAWRNTAEFCGKYLKKGARAAVVGALRTSTYQASNGTKRTNFNINADEVEILSSKSEETPQEDDIKRTVITPKTTLVNEELPF